MLTYAPWVAYQKIVDPPGDRLLKMHFADVAGFREDVSLWQTIHDAYSNAGWGRSLENKLEDFLIICDGIWDFPSQQVFSHLFGMPGQIRLLLTVQTFSHTLYALMYLIPAVGVAAVIAAVRIFYKRSRFDQLNILPMLSILGATIISYAAWISMLFGPSATIIHQGSYFNNISIMTALSVIIWRIWKPLAYISLGLNIIISLEIFAPWARSAMVTSHLAYDVLLGLGLLTIAGSCYGSARSNAKVAMTP